MKMLLTATALLLIANSSFAALSVKPGLWEVKTQTGAGKEKADALAKMKEGMAKMPADQRKMMEDMMNKNGMSMGENGGIKLCYSEEMLKNNDILFANRHSSSKCTNKITSQTATKIAMEFTCQDGSKGNGEWNLNGDTKYTGLVKITNAEGKKTEISHTAQYLSSNCGSVKPLSIPNK